jgi:hypothetical protein
MIRPWYLQHYHRKLDVPSSVLVNYHVKADPENGVDQVPACCLVADSPSRVSHTVTSLVGQLVEDCS